MPVGLTGCCLTDKKRMEQSVSKERDPFFTRDPQFYKTFFSMLLMVALQNLVAYSVNMADNIMLGSYDQDALSGAATVNQIFFLIQQFAIVIGNALTTLSSQYWGKKDTESIRRLSGTALRFGLFSGIGILLVCGFFSRPLLSIFTSSESIIAEGQAYLWIIQWSFVLFILTNTMTSLLRSVGTVRISFVVSVISLVVNVSINYTLIFGKFGFPEMGIRGAAVGTLIARALELCIIGFYVLRVDKKIRIGLRDLVTGDRGLRKDYFQIMWPLFTAQMLWAVSVPLQTAILGHISDDALAANSVATTFFQYLKVIVSAMSSTAAVVIGNAIGEGNLKQVKQEARTISIMDVGVGVILALILLALREPLLSMYNLTDTAMELASHMILILAVVMVGMSYEMPLGTGVMTGGGDVRFHMAVNLISVWLIVMPLSFAAAFWWKLPVEAVVVFIQSDQLFKGIPLGIRLHSYKWIHELTKKEEA